ncbi:MAG TPA: sialidase family protein [Terriglobia bacterium]|nr:sialidase family protein [Terriglobia bacterium]
MSLTIVSKLRTGLMAYAPVFIGLIGLAVSAAPAPAQNLPAAPGGQVIDLTAKPGFFNEPSIAVNPANPRQVVAAWQVPASVAYSEDGGRTWKTASGTASHNYRVSGDVSVAYDRRGHAILCYIAFDQLGTENYWAHNATRNGIFIRRSLDGGKTWEKKEITVIAHATEPGLGLFEDKPYVVADDTSGPYAGNLYVGWTEFSLAKSVILFSRSTDGGETWDAPMEISTHEGLPRDDNGSVEGFTGAVGPDGALYVVWADGSHVVFTESRDGGKSFAPTRNVVDVAPPYFKVSDVDRANGFPEIAIDPRPGPPAEPPEPTGPTGYARGGKLYVTWSDYRNGDVDVFCAASADLGATWSPAVRVNSDDIHNGADQFFQWLAVDPTDGSANVIFYDRRGDLANHSATVTLARSTDGGRQFTNYAWTDKPFDAEGDFIGDYTGIATYGGRVYGIWAEEAARQEGHGKKHGKNRAAVAPHRRTRVRVGVADFTSAARAAP